MIKIKIKKKQPLKLQKRLKNKARLRKKVIGTAESPRLAVYRSQNHIYAQLIDDTLGKTLASASSLKKDLKGNREGAKKVGEEIAKKSLKKNIKKVVFDRGGFIYHGRIETLAESARENGLKF